ncbi:MAG TPA: tripartite tricarboxylate transporter substrate-binding protein [Candidatus Binatia bacterium]|nr:tripartite tricarboxylate transporter substrate-binding protein [Candidatus Binatia bacterium]
MMTKIVLTAFVFGLVMPGSVFADDFYKGKTVRVIVGGSAGGGFDTYSRVMARHMGKHIPGNPALLVENMTGAGTLIAAKYLHSSAKPDGLSFGIFNGGLILGRVIGMKGIDFDVRELQFIGVPVQDSTVCSLRKESGVGSVDQWYAAKSPIKLGGLGPGNSVSDVPRVVRAALDLPLQMVDGYKGTAEVRMAADAGELHGACWAWESMRVSWANALKAGEVKVVLQVAMKKIPDLPNVPAAMDLAKSNEARQLLKAGAIDPAAIVRVYVAPPRTPKERVEILRNAFAATLTDPEFVAETRKINLDVNPLTGDEVKKIVDDLFKLPAPMVPKLAGILSGK